MSPPPPEDWDEVRLAAMLRGGWRRAQATMTRALAESGLSGLEYHLLLAVSAAGESGIRQVEVAQELNAPEGRISLLAHQLGERGLIEALRCEPDRRYVRLRLRPAGRRLLRTAMRCQREHLHEMVSGFDQSTVVTMMEFVARQYLGLDVQVVPRSGAVAGHGQLEP